MNKLRNTFVDYTSKKLDKKQILNKIINDTENRYFLNNACLTYVQIFGCHFTNIMFHKGTIHSGIPMLKVFLKYLIGI